MWFKKKDMSISREAIFEALKNVIEPDLNNTNISGSNLARFEKRHRGLESGEGDGRERSNHRPAGSRE